VAESPVRSHGLPVPLKYRRPILGTLLKSSVLATLQQARQKFVCALVKANVRAFAAAQSR
jgi:hypothetical protein